MLSIFQALASRKGLTFLAIATTLVLGILLGPIITDRVFSFQEIKPVSRLEIVPDTRSATSSSPDSLAQGFRRVAKSFEPYVVNVSARSLARNTQGAQPPGDIHDLFRFFGQMPEQREVRALGSGTIVDPKGYILTNQHVIAPRVDRHGNRLAADRIEVVLSNGDQYPAQIVGADDAADIAVLKIEPKEALPAAKVGDTRQMQIGDWVLAIGSPFGFEQTVTAGIVSAKSRPGDRFGGGANAFGDYLQTDAAINPGNSGGPLVNMNGELIGINSFISTSSGGSEGIGFAIPSHVFVNSYNQLVTTGHIERGWLGVSMNTALMTEEMAGFFGVAGDDPSGIKDGDGVLITQLIGEDGAPSNDGPAAEAGIRPEDVIVKIGDQEVESNFDLRSRVASTAPGETLVLTVVRKGEVKKFNVTLARRTFDEANQTPGARSFEEPEPPEPPKEIGIRFTDLSPSEARQMRIEDEDARVVIEEVQQGSLGADAGLRPGHVVTHVNGKKVNSADDFYEDINALRSGQAAILRVLQPDASARATVFYTSFVKP